MFQNHLKNEMTRDRFLNILNEFFRSLNHQFDRCVSGNILGFSYSHMKSEHNVLHGYLLEVGSFEEAFMIFVDERNQFLF